MFCTSRLSEVSLSFVAVFADDLAADFDMDQIVLNKKLKSVT
jgi:hypothetical protein